MSRTVSEISYLIQALLYLPYFWFIEGVRVFTRTFWRSIVYLDQVTATTVMARLLFLPLFGDYTFFGRVLGFPFRLFRLVGGAIVIGMGAVGVLGFFLLWFIFPFWLWWNFPDLAKAVFAGAWVAALYYRLGKPYLVIKEPWKDGFYILDFACDSARRAIRFTKDSSHLFQKLARSRAGRDFLFRAGIGESALPNQDRGFDPNKLKDISLSDLYRTAYDLAFSLKCKHLCSSHLLAAAFKLLGERQEDAWQTLLWEKRRQDWIHLPFIWQEEYEVRPIGGVNRGWTGKVTPTLDAFSSDLTREAAKGRLKLMLGKGKPLEEVARILARERKANALLVGPPGSGKSSLVEGIAQEVVRGARFESLRGRRIIQLDVGSLVAGTQTEGELGERLQRIINEIESSRGIVLFIDEIHNLILSGAEAQTSFVFNSLRPHLGTGKFQLIGATSWENYRKYISPNEAFSAVFELVEVPAASREESIEILEYQAQEMEQKSRKERKRIRITFPAIRTAVEMSDRLIYERVLPDKALDLLEEAVLAKQNTGGGVVGEEEIAVLVAEKTKVPVTKITHREAKELLKLEESIHKGLIDQEEAVKGVSDALRRARAGLREEEKPIATFLFVGPTGVGKTELAKVLAKIYFGGGADKTSSAGGGASFGGSPLIRVDMSEFADLKNIYRLIGSPPGAGTAEPGQLTEAVRQRPFSLILLDEFEKAHPQILNLFLQVFDDGRLTDGKGETVDFTNTIIIATSNAGTKYIQDQLAAGRTVEQFKTEFTEQIRGIFPPELLNRFDGVMIFKPLSQEHLIKIVELKVKSLEKDLAAKHIRLLATPEFTAKIAELGYAPAWGARPLTRVMQDLVESRLATKILAGEIKEGQTVTLDLKFLGG
uniref:ATP-dependent Clp protease ATP-binding subunit n=1 Tax=candidate division WWE3 bacterium TaxID=2053526 RepID=A0A832E0W0_UNCKA